MSTATETPPGAFGSATEAELVELDQAIATLRGAESDLDKARANVRRILLGLFDKGAKRRHLARRADVSDQTITHMAYGRSGGK